MVESGAAALVRLCAELDDAAQSLRRAVDDDPDGPSAADLQRRAELAVGRAARVLANPETATIEPVDQSTATHSGRVMLARDLLIAVDLVRRALGAHLSSPPASEPAQA